MRLDKCNKKQEVNMRLTKYFSNPLTSIFDDWQNDEVDKVPTFRPKADIREDNDSYFLELHLYIELNFLKPPYIFFYEYQNHNLLI